VIPTGCRTARAPSLLVTGGVGYLGSQVLRDLATDARWEGAEVRVLDNMSEGDYRALMGLGTLAVDFVEGDILDRGALRYSLRGVEAVIHLAGIVRSPMSFFNPTQIEQVNHWGTANVVECCIEAGVRRLVFASSAVAYGAGGPRSEDAPLNPIGPFAQSKCSAEEAILARAAGDLEPTILRFGTLFGLSPVPRFRALVNRFALLAGLRKPLTVFGTGEQRRAIVHVADASRALLAASSQPPLLPDRTYNIALSSPSVLEIVEAIEEIDPSTRAYPTLQDAWVSEPSFILDNSRASAAGWVASIDLRDGIAEIMRAVRDGFPADAAAPG